jgi:DNA-directed RNA polymerase alpha subunit
MQDEVLAHRIGLIPLKINPRDMEFAREYTVNRRFIGTFLVRHGVSSIEAVDVLA